MPHSLAVSLFLDSTARAPEVVYGDNNTPVIRLGIHPADVSIYCHDRQPREQYAAYKALAAACEELAEAILQRSMAGTHAGSEPAMTRDAEMDAVCWRGECRNGCYYPDACNAAPGVEADYDAPSAGDIYRWGDSHMTIRVLSVGRKHAQIRVTQAGGSTWTKNQPLPFPESFIRIIPPAKPDADPATEVKR